MAVTSAGEELESEVEKESKNSRTRSKRSGVPVINGRKTCHQCRQRPRDVAAECKNLIDDQQCPLKYCQKCLLNRYGEKAEEVALLDDWTCPKCKGICNCSFCMKKRGHKPTGVLVRTARENGFSSVSELLQVKDSGASPRSAAKESTVASPRKPEKENSFDENSDSHSQEFSPIFNKKHKKAKGEGLQDMDSDNKDDDASLGDNYQKKSRLTGEISTNKVSIIGDVEGSLGNRSESQTESDNILKEAIDNSEAEHEKMRMETRKSTDVVCPNADENSSVSRKRKSMTEFENVLEEEVKNNEDVEGVMVERKFKRQSPNVSEREVTENIKVEHEKKKLKIQMSRDITVCSTANEKSDSGNCKNLEASDGLKCFSNINTAEYPSNQTEDDTPSPLGTSSTAVAGVRLNPFPIVRKYFRKLFCHVKK